MQAGHKLGKEEKEYIGLQFERNSLLSQYPIATARTRDVVKRIQNLYNLVKKMEKGRPEYDALKLPYKSPIPMSAAERKKASRLAKTTEAKQKELEEDRLRKAKPAERERTRLRVARLREGRKNVSLQSTSGQKRVKHLMLAGDKSRQAGVSSSGGVRPLLKKSKSGSEQQQSFAGVGSSSPRPTRLKKSKSGLEQSSAGVGCSSSRTPVNSANGVQGESSPGVGCSSTRTPSNLKKSKRVEHKKSSAGVGCSPSRTPANSAIVVPVAVEVESCQPPDESSAGVSRSWTQTPVNSAGNRRLSFADDLGRNLETCSSAPDILHPEQFPAYPEWKFSCSNLSCKEEEEVKELADLLQAQFVKEYERSVTHLIVKTDDK